MNNCNFEKKNNVYIEQIDVMNFSNNKINILNELSKLIINELYVNFDLLLNENIVINNLYSNKYKGIVGSCNWIVKELDGLTFYYYYYYPLSLNYKISSTSKIIIYRGGYYKRVVNINETNSCRYYIKDNNIFSYNYIEIDCNYKHNILNTLYSIIPISRKNKFQYHSYYYNNIYSEK